jgi:CheY-like chemotaxis protein
MSPLHNLFVERPRSSSLRGRRVLVVEDEFLLAQDLLEELLDCDAEVMGPVASVAEALAILESSPPPYMAILDIKLSDGMVYPVADALRRLGVPFIFASGYDRSFIPEAYANVTLAQKPVALRDGATSRWM